MKIKLSDHFSFKRLFLFTAPSVGMMVFTSIYGVVDGYFVSNIAGKTEFASVNFIMPFLLVLGSFGFMFGAGGSALVSKTLGEGEEEKANKIFSLLIYISFLTGVVFAFLGILFIKPVALILGASEDMLELCISYGRVVLLALPFYMLQYEFQSFMIAAEKPRLGFAVTVVAGVANMALDALFIGIFRWGVVGAAAATAVSQTLGGVIPFVYFASKNKSLLQLKKTTFDMKAILKVCANGSSEFVSNISMSVVSMLYNYQLMKFIGEDGVSAYGTFMYIGMIFVAIFIGYSTGVAPVISYNYGAKNKSELKNLFQKSVIIVASFSVIMLAFAEAMAVPLSKMFVGYDDTLFEITKNAIIISSASFLFSGFGIFASSFFTALNNGGVSAVISFLRTMVFQVSSIILLPLIIGAGGIWTSITVAEALSTVVAAVFILKNKNKYGY